MSCHRCGRPSVAVLEQDGVAMRVCGRCVELIVANPGFGDFLADFQHRRQMAERCPNCDRSVAESEQTGILGCPLCYEVISQSVLVSLGARLLVESRPYAP